MPEASFGGALLAGLLSFVSPCVLPIVPPYLAYLAGLSFEELSSEGRTAVAQRQIALSALGFVLGFTTVFTGLGATASTIGQAIAQYFHTLSIIAGILIVLMGLHFIGVYRIALLYREARFQPAHRPAGIAGAYVMGLAFAFGWTPCVGPVLASILLVAGAADTAGRGAALLATYSLGIGLPFLVAALFAARFIDWAARFRRHMRRVEIAMGVLLVATGVLFVAGQMPIIAG